MAFDVYIGIDYSGAGTPTSRTARLQVYVAESGQEPKPKRTPKAPEDQHWNWSRKEIADWLIELSKSGTRFIAGIDHAFSFPISYLDRHNLRGWDQFLDDFCRHWPTDEPRTSVDFVRSRNPQTGSSDEFRLTERWTSSAKSVFAFEVLQGNVAKSTHAGIPWLRKIRRNEGDRVQFWPFDGWALPMNKSVLVEVYPSIFRHRYPREERTEHQHDAYSIAKWLAEMDQRKALDHYSHPPLTGKERRIVTLEGWIFGVA